MPTDIVMPQMGESIFEGTITKWLKKPGDKVQRDEPLFEISTDKVDAEIPAPASGVLQDIKVAEGATVQVNTVVGTISADGESARQARPAPAKQESAPAKVAAPAAEPKAAAPAPPTQVPRHTRPRTKKKTTLARHRWSAKSRASTTSISRKCPEPDSAAASPSRTSPHFWSKASPPRPHASAPAAASAKPDGAPPAPASIPGDLVPMNADAQDHCPAHDRVAPHQRPRPLHVRSGPDAHRSVAQQAQGRLRTAQRRAPHLHAVLLCARPSSRCSSFPS